MIGRGALLPLMQRTNEEVSLLSRRTWPCGAMERCNAGLERLRKMAEFLVEPAKSMPQGLKPTFILLHLRRG
jgi:hypothetical protein